MTHNPDHIMYYYLGPGALSDGPTENVTVAMWRRLPAHVRRSIDNSPLYRREYSPVQVQPEATGVNPEDAEAAAAAEVQDMTGAEVQDMTGAEAEDAEAAAGAEDAEAAAAAVFVRKRKRS